MSDLDDAINRARKGVKTIRDATEGAVRKQAAAGARDAVMPWVLLSLALSLYALSKRR